MPEPGRGLRALLLVPAGIAVLFLVHQLVDGITFVSFADEGAHLVGGRVLTAGGLLYRDFVDSHGPLIFALAQGYGTLFGWTHNQGVRALPALLALLATFSIARSPIAPDPVSRGAGVLLAAGLLGLCWLKQGLFLFSFYPLGGALAAIALAGFLAGACFGRFPHPAGAVSAGIATALLAPVAYSFWPAMLCFGLSAIWACVSAGERRPLGWFSAGNAAGALLTMVWMLRYSDLHGFLSFHLAESQTVYARYLHFGWHSFRHGLLPSWQPGERAQTLAVLCWLGSAPALALPGVRRVPWLLLMLGVMSLNARGAVNFQDGTFLWASVALLSVSAMRAVWITPWPARTLAPVACALPVFLAALFLQAASFLPFGLDGRTIATMPRWPIGDRAEGGLFERIRRHARPGEPILALLYQPQLYLLADRLPMPGFYAWFPWDQDYVGHARFGRGRDLCRALRERPPPVIVLDPAPFWGWTPAETLPCLPSILRDAYRADGDSPDVHGALWIRRDRASTAP